MEQKIDELLQSITTLENAQQQSQQDITAKLNRLEHDVATSQEETLQLIAKKAETRPRRVPIQTEG